MNYIDLFAGAGGLSEGFKRAGFNPVAHVEYDKDACLTLKTRTAYHYLKETNQLTIYYSYLTGEIDREKLYSFLPEKLLEAVIEEKISNDTLKPIIDKINGLLGSQKVDLIVGGPPCQAYSLVGRSRMGKDVVVNDERYSLYEEYGMFLTEYKPKCFVFENVRGLLSAEKGLLYRRIKKYFRSLGYRVEPRILKASDYGVLQSRERVIIIGKKGEGAFEYPIPEKIKLKESWNTKNSLFSDLEPLKAGEEKHISKYSAGITDYLQTTDIRNGIDFVTQHVTRPHNERDLAIYKMAIEQWLESEVPQRLFYPNLPEHLKTHRNQTVFTDRFKVVNPFGISHTVVAHLSKDGHYYIYPDIENPRSISIREAARLQSFPDNYFFEGSRGAAFKQIGNAVPPMLSYMLALKIKEIFS